MEIKKELFSYFKPSIFSIFYLLFIFLLFPKVQTQESKIKFIQSTTLINGNILIIENNEISIYDQYWNRTNHIQKSIEINNKDDLLKIGISKFTEKNFDLIISVIKDEIIIFNNTGGILYNKTISSLESGNSNIFNIIPIERNDNEYNYAIAQATSNRIQLQFFIFNNKYMSNILINTTIVNDSYLKPETLSCNLMSNLSNSNENKKAIVCFYYNYEYIFGRFFVDIKNFSITFQGNFTTNAPIMFLKSIANSEKNKSLICFGNYPYGKSNCTIYSFENDSFSEFIEYEVYCEWQYYLSKFEYIQQTNQFIFICAYYNKITLARFDKDFNYIGQYNHTEIKYIEYFSILYLENSCNYIIFYYDETYNKFNISIDLNDENNQCKMPTTNHTSSIMTSLYNSNLSESDSIMTSTYNSNLSDSINSDHITSILTDFIQSSSINTHSTEKYTSYITNVISSSPTIYTTYILSSQININNTSNYSYNTFPIISDETLPSTQNIKEDTIDIKKEELINELDKIIDEIELGQIYKKKR
jgi:hypothetical protein